MSIAIQSNLLSPAEPGSDPEAVSDDVARIFAGVSRKVLLGFVLGSLALVAASRFSERLIPANQATWISIASGLISLVSLLPGVLIGRNVPVDKAVRSSVAIIAAAASITIRFAGTVALFVACRYYFGRESHQVVFLVVGWYVYLTSIETFQLACGIASLDRSSTN